jgi:hypothetical protein
MYVSTLERKVAELERKVDLMQRALEVFKTWMECINEDGDLDQKIFDSLNERVTELENRNIVIDPRYKNINNAKIH